jgi:hypothetical protein
VTDCRHSRAPTGTTCQFAGPACGTGPAPAQSGRALYGVAPASVAPLMVMVGGRVGVVALAAEMTGGVGSLICTGVEVLFCVTPA